MIFFSKKRNITHALHGMNNNHVGVIVTSAKKPRTPVESYPSSPPAPSRSWIPIRTVRYFRTYIRLRYVRMCPWAEEEVRIPTGKLVVVAAPQYLSAARSYALPAFSSLSYPPVFKR